MKVGQLVSLVSNPSTLMSINCISTSGDRCKCQWLTSDNFYQEAWFSKEQLMDSSGRSLVSLRLT